MKEIRNIAIYFALTVLAMGCAKTELIPAPEREVSFVVAQFAQGTKAAEITEFTSFSSKAFLHAEGINLNADGTPLGGTPTFQDFFGASGETITYAEGAWEPSHPYYWPKSPVSYINFVSWYANDGTSAIVPTTVTETDFEITRTIGANDNILIADEAWRYRGNTANGTQYNGDLITNGVPTLFHHLLSKVEIKMGMTTAVDANNNTVTYEVVLQDAKLEGLYAAGTISLKNADPSTSGTRRAWWSTAAPTYLWTPTSGSDADDLEFVTSNTNLSTTSSAILAKRSFMPQLLGDDARLVLTYTITTKSNGVVTSSENDIPASIVLNTIKKINNEPIVDWQPNVEYTYNILVNPISKEILLEPTVASEWGFADDINVTVE